MPAGILIDSACCSLVGQYRINKQKKKDNNELQNVPLSSSVITLREILLKTHSIQFLNIVIRYRYYFDRQSLPTTILFHELQR